MLGALHARLLDLLQIAHDEGTLVSLGSDAHAPEQTSVLAFGIAAARLAGLPEDQIINCCSPDDLVGWGQRRESVSPFGTGAGTDRTSKSR